MFKNKDLQTLTQRNSEFEEAVEVARQCVASATTPLDRLSARIDLAFALCLMARNEASSLIEEAVRDARDDFEGTPEEDRAWLVEAAVATMAGDNAAARRRLSRLVARLRDRPLPDDTLSRASFAYANSLLALQERDEVSHWLSVSEAANPRDDAGTRRHFKTLLSQSLLERDPDVACSLVQEAVRGWEDLGGPDDLDRGEALATLAQIQEARGRRTEAEIAFREARRIYEQALGLWVRQISQCTSGLANLLARAGRHEEALDEWNRLLPLLEADHPNRNDVLRVIRELEAEIAKSPPDTATDLAANMLRNAERERAAIGAALEEIREAVSSGRFDVVDVHATRLLGDGGTDADAGWAPKTSVRLALEAPQVLSEVRHARATARKKTGRLLEAWVDAIVAEGEEKARGAVTPQLEGLVHEIQASLADSPTPEPSQAYRQIESLAGAVLVDPAQAGILERVAAALCSWAPDDPVFLFALGLATQARGAREDAAGLYERAATLVPAALAPDVRLSRVLDAMELEDERVVAAQARALRKMESFPVDELDRTLATMSGTLVRSWFMREHFVTLLRVGRADDALSVAREMLSEDEAFGHLASGFALARLGRLDEAVQAYTKSIEAEEQKGTDDLADRAHYGRASALALIGHRDGALADLTVAVERNPDLARAALEDDDFRALREHPAFVRLAPRAC